LTFGKWFSEAVLMNFIGWFWCFLTKEKNLQNKIKIHPLGFLRKGGKIFVFIEFRRRGNFKLCQNSDTAATGCRHSLLIWKLLR